MSAESSKGKTENRTRTTARARRQVARQATLRRFHFDVLETRTLMAVLPATVFDQTNPTINQVSSFQTSGETVVSTNDNSQKANDSSPTIAVDPIDPLKLVSTWTINQPNLAPGRTEFVEFATSVDGGKTWVSQGQPQNGGLGQFGGQFGFLPDPSTTNPQKAFAVATDVSVQFDHNGNFYMLWSEHNAGNTIGALRLMEFNFSGTTPAAAGNFATNGPTTVYQWYNESQAVTPMLAVDNSVAQFSDTNSSGNTITQNDPSAGNIYVAWQSVDTQPNNTSNFNPNRILLATSTDGGQTFSAPVSMDPQGNYGAQRDVTPQLVVSQGSAARAAGTNGPNDPGTSGVAPGQVTVVWDNYGSQSQASPPLDQIVSNTIAGGVGVSAPTFSAASVGPINFTPTTAPANFLATTTYTIPVNIADPRFVSLSSLSATIGLTATNVGGLSIVLTPPANSGLQPITLLSNNVNLSGSTNTNIGAGGTSLGIQNGVDAGTTFTDTATRNISNNSGAGAPYIGDYNPEGQSFSTLYSGATPAQLNGNWTVTINNFVQGNSGSVRQLSLNFTSGFAPGNNATIIATTPVRARASGASTTTPVNAQGIAPAPVIASDNTLGAYSPYQGRLYVAYVGRYLNQNTPADNTDIYLVVSDDGGTTWYNPSASTSSQNFQGGQGSTDFGAVVNDDNAQTDGYSEGVNGISTLNNPTLTAGNTNGFGNFDGYYEGNEVQAGGGVPGRPQFMPSIAVDQATGTLGLSWYDARNDASRDRVATYTTTSIDGGNSFSPDVYANDSQIATDAITGNIVNMGPIPADESAPGTTAVETAIGFGNHQGLAMSGGQIYPVWSDNMDGGAQSSGNGNKQSLGIYTNVGYYAAGPRIISATQGPIGLSGDNVNFNTASDGTPQASAFQVTFDRPIDAATFSASDVVVMYHDTTAANLTGGQVPVTSVVPLNSGPFGSTRFQINFAPRTGVGTYSLEVVNPTVNGVVEPDIHDQIRTITTATLPDGSRVTLDAAASAPGSVPVTIPNGSANLVSIPATPLPGNDVLSNVSVTINVTTTNDSSIAAYLLAPDGNFYTLFRQGTVQGSGGFVNTTFTSTDPTAISLRRGDPTNNFASPPNYLPLSSLTKLNGTTIPAGSQWSLEIFNRSNGSASTAKINDFSITYQPATTGQTTIAGNPLDQNIAGLALAGFQPTEQQLNLGLSAPTWPGADGDFFATPEPVTGQFVSLLDQTGQNLVALPVPGTTPFAGPYNTNTLPLILSGPHVVSSTIPGQASTSNTGNLVVNNGVSAIDVTFDRSMNPATITAASILQVMGPAGKISGPFTVTQPNPLDATTFQINFPTQTLSGTYTLTLASNIADIHGNQLDTNLNAGIDVLTGNSNTLNSSTSVVYNAPATFSATSFSNPVANLPLPLTDGKTTVSSLNVPDVFAATELSIQLNITDANDPDLQITLVSPNNVSIPLVPFGTGKTGTHANFTNTVFADKTNPAFNSGTPVANGSPPFFGTYVPAQSIINTLLPANGGNQAESFQAAGTWKLVIVDSSGKTTPDPTGSLTSWSLTFQKPVAISDLGEQVADQATVSFRIFNLDPSNIQSSTTWTAVGPAGVTDSTNTSPSGTNGFAGQVSDTVVDPSDPSGNTVFATGASGGVWKTTDFLTNDPNGPTWVPLTDFGPTSAINIGSIAVFPRNNDPRQTIVIAGTGDGSTANNAPNSGTTAGGNTYQGVGFIISTDGGATWKLLDSTNNNLPYAQRDHLFAQVGPGYNGTSTMKVVVDPHLTPSGGVIIYAAMSGINGGLWKSIDTGQTWSLLSTAAMGNCTDVVLDTASATVNALGQATGNASILYAAFPGSGVYISSNAGGGLIQMAGGNVDPLISNQGPTLVNGVVVQNGSNAPIGVANGGRILLARPALVPPSNPNYQVLNTLYEGWLYAYVPGTGLYLTKDKGQTWTQLKLNGVSAGSNTFPIRAIPSNNDLGTGYNVASDGLFGHPDYSSAITVDPTNPNIVYLGGTANGNQSGFIRVDATNVNDSHALVPSSGQRNDGGASSYNSTGSVAEYGPQYGLATYEGTTSLTNNQSLPGPYLNLTLDPNNPFTNNSTLFTYNVLNFVNDGSGVTWTPVDAMLYANATSLNPSSNIHNITTFVDPITGDTRLIVSDDEGVFTGELSPSGTLETSIGTNVLPTYSRNGNLQVAQLFYGAAEPSVTLANGTSTPLNLFLANGQNLGQIASDPNILTDGNTAYAGSLSGANAGFYAASSADQGGVGIGVDQQGNNVLYRYLEPAYGGNGTDFFQVSTDGGQTWVSRTSGLVQVAQDPQWPGQSPIYPSGGNPVTNLANAGNGAIKFGNFTVNPVNSSEVIISSASGRIFSTSNQGEFWLSIGEPGALDGSYAPALTFGAPDPTAAGGVGNLNSFIYAGTVNGNIFVTTNGGGTWTNIASGLDGSPVVKIIADPTRGSHDAYAVTQNGVYYMANSVASATNTPTWISITGNLFSLTDNPFNQAGVTTAAVTFLSSIQADWRYAIPNAVTTTTGTGTGSGTGSGSGNGSGSGSGSGVGSTASGPSTHPILYVSGDGGVFQSLDQGTTWTRFPSVATNNAPVDGGYLPVVQVTDLSISVGKIDPTTGFPVAQTGDPNLLLATTFGRGQFAIKLSPQVLPSTLTLDTKLPSPSGSNNGTDAQGLPLVKTSQPVFDGVSEQSAFGNTVYITLYDDTDPSNPVYIGGFNPALDPTPGNPTGNPTAIPANETNSAGNFSVAVNSNGFTANGVHTIGVQATDQSGSTGNLATKTIDLLAHLTSLTAPAVPTLGLAAASNSSGSNVAPIYTNVASPIVTGTTDPGVTVQVNIIAINGAAANIALAPVTSNANGVYQVQLPSEADGSYTLQATATNPSNNLSSVSQPFTFNILTSRPSTAPTLTLQASSDTGIVGDNITTNRYPVFTGVTVPNGKISVYASKNGVPVPPVLATATANASGVYSVTLPTALNDGKITLQVQVTDAANNAGLYPSTPLTVTVVTTTGDYTGSGKTTPALFSRNANGTVSFVIQGVTNALGSVFAGGSATGDIPIVGDFDGDGVSDKALYRPSAGAFFIARSRAGGETINLSQYNAAGSVPVVGDFDGDGTSDVGLYNPSSGAWTLDESSAGLKQITFNTSVFTPQTGDVPVPGDYTGAGYSELAIYRPSTGQFFIKTPGTLANGQDNISVITVKTGAAGDVPVPGNYLDTATFHQVMPAVFNPSTGVWLVQGQAPVTFKPGDIPAPGDYDGTGRTELAVYRPSINAFVINGPSGTVPLGSAGMIPLTTPLSYRSVISATPTLTLSNTSLVGGNVTSARHPIFTGTTDPGAFIDLLNANGTVINGAVADSNGNFAIGDPTTLANGTYTYSVRAHIANSTIGPVSPKVTVQVVTVQGDYTGAGYAEPSLFVRGANNSLLYYVQGGGSALNGKNFSTGKGDVPIVGDFLGNGVDQLVDFTPSTGNWTIEQPTSTTSQVIAKNFGTGPNYIPVAGDYAGTGVSEPAVYETTTGKWFIAGQATIAPIIPFKAGDVPVPGNYDNTGKTEPALYRPSTNTWYIDGPFGVYTIGFGGANDVPVPGNYNATPTNNSTEPADWVPAAGVLRVHTAAGGTQTYQFKVGDIPAPGDYDKVGMTEPAVYRPSTGQFIVYAPGATISHVVTTQTFGGAGFTPLLAPYQYRAIPSASASVKPAVVTTPAVAAAPAAVVTSTTTTKTSLTPTAVPAPVTVTITKSRPTHVVAPKATTVPSPRSLLKTVASTRKGH